MFNPSQYPTSFTYQYPNAQFSYFPPVPSDPPPGVDPVANSASYPFTHVAFQTQPPFVQDPNAASLGWLVQPAQPISYQPSINSSNESSLVATTADSLWNNHRTNQPNAFPGTSVGIDNVSLPSEMSSVAGQVMCAGTTLVSGGELETKRRKVDAAVGFFKTCEMCNVTTNSPEVYRMHLAGKRHAAQANLMRRRAGLNSVSAIQSKSNGILKKDTSVWCEFCKICCNSQDAYAKHIVGRKHQRNLDQLGKLTNQSSTTTTNVPSGARNPQIGPMEKVSQSKAPSKEDLETKKQKVIRGGAAAREVRTCMICNVVCNSQIAFSFHLSGQKHAAMVAKQALKADSHV